MGISLSFEVTISEVHGSFMVTANSPTTGRILAQAGHSNLDTCLEFIGTHIGDGIAYEMKKRWKDTNGNQG
jgi:hypothetical protein